MNRERLSQLADAIEQLKPGQFNMAMWAGREPWNDYANCEPTGPYLMDCGTAGCIAGWAVACFRPETPAHLIPQIAADILDLDYNEKHDLFRAWGRDRAAYPVLNDIPSYKAVEVLRRAAKTGEISWN